MRIRRRRVGRKLTTGSNSVLAEQITAIHPKGFGASMSHFLGELSIEGDNAGHGMLSVVVVQKTGVRKPGTGFHECALFLGRDVANINGTSFNELANVYRLTA